MKTLSRSSKSDRPSDRKLASLIKSKSSRTLARPPVPRGRSPDMKRPSVHLKKGPHGPRGHIPSRKSTSPYASRVPSLSPVDSSKYQKKRKPYSNSPPPGRSSGPLRKHLTPPPHSRMSGNGSRPPPGYDVTRKKMRRESPRVSLVQRPLEKPMHGHLENRMPLAHRVIEPPRDYAHERAREYSPRPTTSHSTYTSAGPSREGFSVSQRNHPRRMVDVPYEKRERDDYISVREKHHSQTLNERFRYFNDDDIRSQDHHIQYSRADLQNITIDVKRGMRETSPTRRTILNPADVKLVRHPSEGRRPIFDREEIKRSIRDMREDPYNEQKLSGGQHFGLNYGELENFEITRHKFDTASYQGPVMRDDVSLSDRWRRNETRRANSPIDREERSRVYSHRSRSPEPYRERDYAHRPHSMDRDFRGERYPPTNDHHVRPLEYPESRRPLPNDPSDLRHSLAVKKKDNTLHRQRALERRHDHPSSHDDYRHNYPPPPRRMPMDNSPEKIREKRSLSPRRMDYPKSRRDSLSSYSRERSLDRGRPRHAKPPEYARRSVEPLPKLPNYYEHDKREPPPNYRGRGSPRGGYRGRSTRGRPVRGLSRGGGSRGRGSFRSTTSFRGKGTYPPRRGKRSSPHLWEHDMYDKVKQDY